MTLDERRFLTPVYNSYQETGTRHFTYTGYDRRRWLETVSILRSLAVRGYVEKVSNFVFADVPPSGIPCIHFVLTDRGIHEITCSRARGEVDGWTELPIERVRS